jgi:hypothetical protein
MNSPSSTPSASAPTDEMWNGLIQSSDGVAAPPLTSATTANRPRIDTSALSSHFWVVAFSSMPIRQIQVISTIQTQPTRVTAHAVAAADCQPNRRKV